MRRDGTVHSRVVVEQAARCALGRCFPYRSDYHRSLSLSLSLVQPNRIVGRPPLRSLVYNALLCLLVLY